MDIHREDTAIVFIDPQNDVLSEKGLSWPLVRESLQENNTIENMERIFKAAKAHGFEVFISPHYFYPTDKRWKFNGPLETDEATSGIRSSQSAPDPSRPSRFKTLRANTRGSLIGFERTVEFPSFVRRIEIVRRDENLESMRLRGLKDALHVLNWLNSQTSRRGARQSFGCSSRVVPRSSGHRP